MITAIQPLFGIGKYLLFREAETNNLPRLRRIFIRLQGARREHNGLCDRRATQKPDQKTIKMGKLFIADSLNNVLEYFIAQQINWNWYHINVPVATGSR